jgi:hypothetical protein
MSIAEKFQQWWHENWSKLRQHGIAYSCFHAGYEQGYADGVKKGK